MRWATAKRSHSVSTLDSNMTQKHTWQISNVCWTEKTMFPGLINAERDLLGLAGVCAVLLDVTFSKINNCKGTMFFSLFLCVHQSSKMANQESWQLLARVKQSTNHRRPGSISTRCCSAISHIMQCSRRNTQKIANEWGLYFCFQCRLIHFCAIEKQKRIRPSQNKFAHYIHLL